MPRGRDRPMDPMAKFAKRKETLRKKTHELATLCNVAVAVICTGPGGGGGGAEHLPSKEEAVAAVRQYGALPPEQRAAHTEDHARRFADLLEKEGEKLVRVREGGVAGALGSWDGSLEGVTEEKLRELLASIDASLSLAAARSRDLKRRGGAADRARILPDHVHEGEVTAENSVSVTGRGAGNGVRQPGSAEPGGRVLGLPLQENPMPPPNAAPLVADEVVGENSVTGEDETDEAQVLQPPGDADANADDAEWMRELVKALMESPGPSMSNAAAYGAGIEYIYVCGHFMERDAYDFIRFDLGIPPPCVRPDSPEPDDGEPLKLWSWDNSMPPL